MTNTTSRDDEPKAVVLAFGLLDLVMRRMESHPVRTLVMAAGAGYVLGAGVPRFAVRLAVAAVIRRLAGRWLDRWLGLSDAEDEDDESSTEPLGGAAEAPAEAASSLIITPTSAASERATIGTSTETLLVDLTSMPRSR